MLERSDTPWYGSARLFRQSRVGEWPALFEQVAEALRELVLRRGVEAAQADLARRRTAAQSAIWERLDSLNSPLERSAGEN
jgi:hypothetical protein